MFEPPVPLKWHSLLAKHMLVFGCTAVNLPVVHGGWVGGGGGGLDDRAYELQPLSSLRQRWLEGQAGTQKIYPLIDAYILGEMRCKIWPSSGLHLSPVIPRRAMRGAA